MRTSSRSAVALSRAPVDGSPRSPVPGVTTVPYDRSPDGARFLGGSGGPITILDLGGGTTIVPGTEQAGVRAW